MPWCESCHKYLLPNKTPADRHCPNCGSELDEGGVSIEQGEPQLADPKIPWHFWFLAGSIAIYMTYRMYQLIIFLL